MLWTCVRDNPSTGKSPWPTTPVDGLWLPSGHAARPAYGSWSALARPHRDRHVGNCHNRALAAACVSVSSLPTASNSGASAPAFLEENSLDEHTHPNFEG